MTDEPITQSADQVSRDSSDQDGLVVENKPVRFLKRFLRLACVMYLLLLGLLVLFETYLVYPGAYMPNGTPVSRDAGEPIIDVDYQTPDGVSLRGRLLDRPGSPNTVLYFHGNGEKAHWQDAWMRRLANVLDATVMAAEYRGFRGDDHTPNESGLVTDSLAARDFLCQHKQCTPTDLTLYGRSLGGGCAVAVAADGGAKALILERTFDRMVDVAAARYPVFPVRLLMRNQFDSVSRMTDYDGPLIQLHGDPDEVVPMHHGRNLFDAAQCRQKHWIFMPLCGHQDPLPQECLQEVAIKIQEFCSPMTP